MILTRKLFCICILITIIFAFGGFADSREKLRVENYENLHHLRNSNSPRPLSMMNARHLGTDTKFIHDGLLFTYQDRNARNVQIAGDFSSWKPISMTRSKHGIWYYFQKSDPNRENYSYKYIVDGTWTMDPKNHSRSFDNVNSYFSIVQAVEQRFSKQISYRILNKDTVEFRLYRPNARLISLVGDFNNWNPENDLMIKDDDGVWRLTKRLLSGKTYRYKFLIDGEWEIDLFNENSGSDQLGELCSLLVLP